MANLTIFGLTQLTSAGANMSTDLVPVWDNDVAETKKMTLSDLRNLMSPVNWSDSFSSATQATSSWTPNNAAATVNAAIVPKGGGALIASIPNGTATGGNARGSYAVDLQMVRNAATQVASGTYSVIVGGINNTATNDHCFIGAGWANSTTGARGVIGGGEGNSAATAVYQTIAGGAGNSINGNGSRGFIGGGGSNSVTQTYATVVGGQSNTASGQHSFVGGGQSNTASGEHAFIGSGNQNSASTRSAVGGGQQNSASPELAFIGGGYLNSITGGNHYSFIGSGRQNQGRAQFTAIGGGDNNYNGGYAGFLGGGAYNRVSASYATVPGGYRGNAELYGQVAHASGTFGRNGDAQAHELIWRRDVTGTAQTELFLDGASIASVIPWSDQPNPATVWHGTIDVCAMCVSTGNGTTVFGDVEATSYKVTIKRYGYPTYNTVLVGTVQEIGTTNADASMATSVFTIDNNDTNESLRIRFTPPTTAGSTTVIYTMATFRGLQILY